MKMTITTEKLRQYAESVGLDLFGVANIERFKDAPPRMHPAAIMPEAKSVIVVGKRILRGGWRGIEEGTYWPSYTYFDYSGLLNSFFIPFGSYHLACYLEDHGWEATPYYPGVPERQMNRKPLRQGSVPHNVHLAIRIAGVAEGVGEIGWSKVFLTKEFGPRQRLHAVITDAPLEPTPLVKPGTICNRCMECVRGCPGAIPHLREGKTVKIQIEGENYEWADVDMGKCTLMYHGGDPRTSPFLHKDFPGWKFDVTEQEVSEGAAYKFSWTLSGAKWAHSEEFPSGYVVEGHAMLMKWGMGEQESSSFGVEGSRGCMRSCFNYLEKTGRIKSRFHNGEFIKRPRWLLPSKTQPLTKEQVEAYRAADEGRTDDEQ
jgi:epoxyqueuosine reductase